MVLVPNIANPFYAEIIRGIEHVAQQHGYTVLLGDTEGREDREAYYFGLVETRQADGLMPRSRLADPCYRRARAARPNAVA